MYALKQQPPSLKAVPTLTGTVCSLDTVIDARIRLTAPGAVYAQQTLDVTVVLQKPSKAQGYYDECVLILTLPQTKSATRPKIDAFVRGYDDGKGRFVAGEFPGGSVASWWTNADEEPDYSDAPF